MSPESAGVVANPASGRGRVARVLPEALRRFAAGGLQTQVWHTRSAEHARECAAEAAAAHPVVIAAGGDGMVHLVVNGMAGSDAALGILPCGTGNDFATNLGFARRNALDACAALIAGKRRRVDAAQIRGGPIFVCVAGGGFDSVANEVANTIRFLRGTPVYVVATLRTLARFKPAAFTVTVDGSRQKLSAMFVVVGNASSYGGGMQITPGAVLDDHLLDVTIVGAMKRMTLLAQFPRLFKGTHVSHPAVQTMRGRSITIECATPFPLYADGEASGALPATIDVLPGALEVIVP